MRIPRSSSRPTSTPATNHSSSTQSARSKASIGFAVASTHQAYAELQDAESDAKADGYRAFEHQSFVGTAYFDEIAQVITGGDASTLAMAGSTEKEQFQEVGAKAEPVASSPPRLNASETG